MLNKKLKYLQLSQRQRMSPFPNYFSMESISKEMKDVIGYAYREIIIFFVERNTYIFSNKVDHERVGKGVMKKVLVEPDIFVKLAQWQKNHYKKFYNFINQHNKPKKLKNYSNKKLAGLQEGYERLYKELYSHYFPILAIEIYFFNYLKDYINSLERDSKKAAEYINVLITERDAMINHQEKINALETCALIKKNRKWVNYFKAKKLGLIKEKVTKDKELFKLIKAHEKKFFWITRDYDDPVLTFDDFLERFREHLKKDPSRELEKIKKDDEKLQEKIKKITMKLNINKKHQRLFQTMREGVFYKELRKWIVSKTLYYYDPILTEIGRRGGLSLKQVRFLKTEEIRELLMRGKDFTNETNERIKLSVWHVLRGSTRVFIGKKAREYYNFFVKIDPKAKVLQCEAVSSGVARGPVKIVINPDSFYKVKKGDIIATLQATPVFSPVLSKAAGLICDGGPGITSHPATLAREAGIPGVIKARMATKIFKDGEMVEVDGNKGVVRRLS